MDNNFPYDNEDSFSLEDEAPLLAKLKGLPEGFVRPDEHENNLATEVLLKIHRADSFEIPSGYFEDQVDQTMALIAMESETEDFTVPDDYFQTNTEALHTLIDLHDTKQDAGFTVPGNYFDNSIDRIVNVAQQHVPNGYFEELPEQIIDKVRPKKRVISIKRIATWSVSFAAAAAIALLLIPKNPEPSISKTTSIVAEIPVDTLIRDGIPGVSRAESVKAKNVVNSTTSQKTLNKEDVLNIVDVHVLEDVLIEQLPAEENTEILELLLNETDFGQLNDTKQ